jgi:dCMP deaminase
MSRPSLDEYFVKMLDLVATRSTCRRRNVAAILTDETGHLISTGYNGVPAGFPHCTDEPCPGAADAAGDTSKCMAIHAENNAIIQAGGRLRDATRLYCSCSPCFSCTKLILGTNVRTIVVKEVYADTYGIQLLKVKGVKLLQHKVEVIRTLGKPDQFRESIVEL